MSKTSDKLCSVDGCEKFEEARGLCHMHYYRLWRAGKLKLRPATQTALAEILAKSIDDFDDATCVDWPYSTRNGYGQIQHNGRVARVHRIVCTHFHGVSPFKGAQAAHSCNRPICCNPKHLRWATSKENMADKIAAGTVKQGERHGSAKLTEADVLEIRASQLFGSKLATIYCVSPATISLIKTGKRWKHI